MVARNKYMVFRPAAPELTVFADEFVMTPKGDLLFRQVRKTANVNDEGQRHLQEDMVPVLVIAANSYSTVASMPPTGNIPHYSETGAVEMVH